MNENQILINEFLEYKEHIRRCSKHTIRAYRNDLNQYADFLAETKINILNSESKHIQYYLSEIK